MFNLLKQILMPKPTPEPVLEESSHTRLVLALSLYNAMSAKKAFEDMLANARFEKEAPELIIRISYLEKQITLLESDVPVSEKLKFYEDSLSNQLLS